ncbi:MAG: hypothetical protein F9K23_00900 [Bacteroidetes bacterium]|nr:MAG: hypothetical protein F9K23_00900 [Bacteroidota bacterium]
MITNKKKRGFKHLTLYPAVGEITGFTPGTVKQVLNGYRENDLITKVAEGFEQGYEVGKEEIIKKINQ